MYSCMPHHHGKTAGPFCSKFCEHINLGPQIFFELALDDLDFRKKFGVEGAWDEIGWGGEGEEWGGAGRGF